MVKAGMSSIPYSAAKALRKCLDLSRSALGGEQRAVPGHIALFGVSLVGDVMAIAPSVKVYSGIFRTKKFARP